MALQLASDASRVQAVNVRPVVLLSVLDTHTRRNPEQDRVIGVLLGTNVAGSVEVTNCFGVFHARNVAENTVLVRQAAVTALIELHRRINPAEGPVGWFSTVSDGELIDDVTLAVHTFFTDVCPRPIHLLVDTRLDAEHVDVRAYTVAPNVLTKDLMVTFQQLKVNIVATPEERVGIHAMLRAKPSDADPSSSSKIANIADVPSAMASTGAAVARLKSLLDVVTAYVDDVVAGKREADEAIGRMITDALAAVPTIDEETFRKASTGSVRDVLMVSYLTNMASAHISLLERISQVPSRVF